MRALSVMLAKSSIGAAIPRFNVPLPVHSPAVTATEKWITQPIDHFSPNGELTYQERYFINNDSYKSGGPIFFYLGNEADVTLYLNATGLMWENAEDFNALVVFAEHRYYGQSKPYGAESLDHKEFLSIEQALADYVDLVAEIKSEYKFETDQAVIGFGGSYGGMLASWARYKYPHVWDGAIAGSAPIFSFEGMGVNPNFYAEGVTYDVSTEAGCAETCDVNLRSAFEKLGLVDLASTDEGKAMIMQGLHLCDDNAQDSLGWDSTFWVNTALSYMAMGNYPYPSSYILNGNGILPAFPVRVACDFLAEDYTADAQKWLSAIADFAGVYYNSSGGLACNELSAPVNEESEIVDELWGYQYCSEIFQLFGQVAGETDMFWDAPWNATEQSEACFESVGSHPYPANHVTRMWGTEEEWANSGVSNIVWSQGEYDPWKGGGVVKNLTDSLLAVVIPESAHHLDLFFSNEGDTEAVKNARLFEMGEVRKWIDAKKSK